MTFDYFVELISNVDFFAGLDVTRALLYIKALNDRMEDGDKGATRQAQFLLKREIYNVSVTSDCRKKKLG